MEPPYGAPITRQCRAIVGERKMGKSSLLTHIAQTATLQKHGLQPEQFIFVYIDLEGMASIQRDEFWPEVLDQIALAMPSGELKEQFSKTALEPEVRFM